MASVERAPPNAGLADNFLVPACGPCFADLRDSPDLVASLFQVLGVKSLQRPSSCANWSFDEGRPESCFPHRGLHGGILHVFICIALLSFLMAPFGRVTAGCFFLPPRRSVQGDRMFSELQFRHNGRHSCGKVIALGRITRKNADYGACGAPLLEERADRGSSSHPV